MPRCTLGQTEVASVAGHRVTDLFFLLLHLTCQLQDLLGVQLILQAANLRLQSLIGVVLGMDSR